MARPFISDLDFTDTSTKQLPPSSSHIKILNKYHDALGFDS